MKDNNSEETKGEGTYPVEYVILIEINNNGKNFIVALKAVERKVSGGKVIEVNNIDTLFPKSARGIVKWIVEERATNIDKEKALNWLEALRTHRGTELTSQELNSAAKVVNRFESVKQNSENSRNSSNIGHNEEELSLMEEVVKAMADDLKVPRMQRTMYNKPKLSIGQRKERCITPLKA